MLRIPRNPLSVLRPRTLLNGLASQAAGVVIIAATVKYVPNEYARWGIYIVAAAAGAWLPLTLKILQVTKLNEQIEEAFN